VAERHSITVAQLAIAWVLANSAVDVAIVGARRPHQIEQTAPAAEVRLSPETLREIKLIMLDAVSIGGPTPEGM
jgi:aryl-alcohol dehydrogenase-like predicted oxidoreductase